MVDFCETVITLYESDYLKGYTFSSLAIAQEVIYVSAPTCFDRYLRLLINRRNEFMEVLLNPVVLRYVMMINLNRHTLYTHTSISFPFSN